MKLSLGINFTNIRLNFHYAFNPWATAGEDKEGGGALPPSLGQPKIVCFSTLLKENSPGKKPTDGHVSIQNFLNIPGSCKGPFKNAC